MLQVAEPKRPGWGRFHKDLEGKKWEKKSLNHEQYLIHWNVSLAGENKRQVISTYWEVATWRLLGYLIGYFLIKIPK